MKNTSLRPSPRGPHPKAATSRMQRLFLILSALALAVLATTSFAQTNDSWTDTDGPKNGNNNWSDQNNWSGGVVPNGNYDADVPLLSFPFTVPTLDESISLTNLTIETGAAVEMNNGLTLTLTGATLTGGLIMNSTGSNTSLVIGNTVTYTSTTSGNCCLQMFNTSSINGPGTLINQGTISYGTSVAGNSGAIGLFGLTLQNQGTIYTGQNSSLTLFAGNNWINTGTIQSANPSFGCLGGEISIPSGIINQQSSGQILASSGLIVLLGTIQGGSLATGCGGSGLIQGLGATLSNLTITGGSLFQIPTGSSTILQGTITNNGTITLQNTDPQGKSKTTLSVPSAVTLAGSGGVVLGGGFNSQLTGSGPLTNQQLITGQGAIHILGTLANQGAIAADLGNGNSSLIINSGTGGVTNTGTITADPNSIIDLSGGKVANTGGTISAGSGTALLDNGVTITGGNLIGGSSTSGNYMEAKSATLNGSSPITVSGTFALLDGDVTTVSGTIILNGAVDVVGATKNTDLKFLPNTVLQGTGTLNFENDSPYDMFLGNGPTDKISINVNVAGNVTADDGTFILGAKNTWTTGPFAGQPTILGPNSTLSILGTFQVDQNTTAEIEGKVANDNATTNTWTGGTLDILGNLKANINPIQTLNGGLNLASPYATFTNLNGLNLLSTIGTLGSRGNLIVGPGMVYQTTVPLNTLGTIWVQPTSYFDPGGDITETSGKFTIDGTLNLPSGHTFNATGGGIFGNGTLNGSLSLGATTGTTTATLTAGDSVSSPGTLHVVDYTQNAFGKLVFPITPSGAGKIDVTDTATLGGTVGCVLAKGYVPPIGTQWTVLTAPTVIATWTTATGCTVNSTETIQITYSQTQVIFTVVAK